MVTTVTNATGPVTDAANQVVDTATTPLDPGPVDQTVGTVGDAVHSATGAARDVGKTVSDSAGHVTGGGSGGGPGVAMPGVGSGVGLPGVGGSGSGVPGPAGGSAQGGGDGGPGHDGSDPLTPAALGAFSQAGAPAAGGATAAADAPPGILGLDAGLGKLTGADGHGLLSGAALLARNASYTVPGAGGSGGDDIVDTIVHAIHTVVANLPDWSKPIIAALLLLVLILALRAFVSGRRARRLEGALREKAADNAVLLADNEVLQAALVPDLPARLGGVALSVDYRPADGLASGGDFYDAFALDEHRVGVILGDVSGHDRQAIRRAADVRHKLRAYLELGLEPRLVLQAAGEALSSTDSLEGDFATAAVAVHDVRAGTLTYACAGHPAPIVTGSAAHHPVSVCSSPALGWGLPTGRRQTTVVLGDNDTVCFFTDGLIEARQHGGFVGRAALERLVRKLGETGTAKDLLGEIIGLAHEADDDLAALIIRTGTPVAVGAGRLEELEFEAPDVQRKAPERFLAACDAPMVVIERLSRAARRAVEDDGRGVLRVRFDSAGGALEAAVEPLQATRAPARAVAL
ncbi:MAG TPA: PP2C family protein-serine/threonine phosphatase [Solirubrobacteraceae bacterium]